MSVSSAGPLGMTDNQAVSQWDYGSLAYSLTGLHSGVVNSPAIPVAQWANLYIKASVSDSYIIMYATWYVDQALTTVTGQRVCQLGKDTTPWAQIMYPNQGPWVVVTTTRGRAVGSYTPEIYVIPSNRVHPVMFLPTDDVLLDFRQPILAGATATEFPSGYYGGPVAFYTNGGSQGVTVMVDYLDPTFAYHQFTSWTVAAGANDQRVFITPPDALRVRITNASGVADNNTATLVMIPTITGAA